MTTLTTVTPSLGGGLVSAGPGRPAPPVSVGLSGADVWRIIRQRLVMIILLWLLFSAVAAGITLILWRYYPDYVATAYIRVDSLAPPDPEKRFVEQATTQEQIDRELQNQKTYLESPEILQAAIEHPDIRRTKWYVEEEEEARTDNESIVDLLRDIVSASPIRDSNLLAVTAVWKYKEEVDDIVNTIVEIYMKKINQLQKDVIRGAEEQIGEELALSRRLYDEKVREVQEFAAKEPVSDAAISEINENVALLSTLATELRVTMLGRKTDYEVLMNADPRTMPISAQLQAILEGDMTLSYLERLASEAEQSLNLALQRFGPNHRFVAEATAARDAVVLRLEQERAAKILRYQTELVEQAKRDYLEANAQLEQLVNDELMPVQARQKDLEEKRRHYESLLDEREMARFHYENLLETKNAIDIKQRQELVVQIQPHSSAMEPKRMSSPRLKIWIPAGCVLALAVSMGLVLLVDVTDKSVRTPRDVLRISLPILGTVPTIDDDEIEIERAETATLDAPHSITAEAFRNLRANLFFSAPAEQQGVILVTSPSGGNGKTTVATNLAIAIALSGRRVLLIDANFRRPSLPRLFSSIKAEGLSNILVGQARLRDYAANTAVPGLDVLGAGPIPPNPAELLGSSFLRDVVVDARTHYDQVIFDGPPVLLVSDAMVLAGAVDGCVIVCEYRMTSRGALQRTQSSLDAIGARIFGAVLNKVQTRAGGYFRKAYREFYEYHEPEEAAEETGGGQARPRLDAAASAAAGLAPDEQAGAPSPDEGLDTLGLGGESAEFPADFEPDLPRESGPEGATFSAPPPPSVSGLEDQDGLDVLDDLDDLDIIEDHDLSAPPDFKSAIADLGPSVDPHDLDHELKDLDSDEFKIDELDLDGDPDETRRPNE